VRIAGFASASSIRKKAADFTGSLFSLNYSQSLKLDTS